MSHPITTCSLLASSLLLGSITTNVAASARFDGTESYRYERPESFLDSAARIGLACWVDPKGVPTEGAIIDNRDAAGTGVWLGVETVAGVTRLGFVYTAPEHEIAVATPVASLPSGWFHVAVNLDGAAGRCELFIDGVRVDLVESAGALGPAHGARTLTVGAGFEGDVHDLVLIARPWSPDERARLLTTSADDVLASSSGVPADVLFREPFRQKPGTKSGASTVTSIGHPGRGLGPPLAYSGQRPTVLVIGDTQCLDSDQSEALATRLATLTATLDTRAIFHVGDWVNDGAPGGDEGPRARALLDGIVATGVPFGMVVGNHDYWGQGGPDFGRDVRYFSADGMECEWNVCPTSLLGDWVVAQLDGGVRACDASDRGYVYAFEFDLGTTASPDPQLGVVMPWVMNAERLGWMQGVAASHADRPVWFATHELLNSGCNGNFVTSYVNEQLVDGDPVSPVEAWQGVADGNCPPSTPGILRQIPNLQFAFCGHNFQSGQYSAAHRCDQLSVGPEDEGAVHTLLVNGQGAVDDQGDGNGGDGFLQILTYYGDVVTVESYLAIPDVYPSDLACMPNHDFAVALYEPCPSEPEPEPNPNCGDINEDCVIDFADLLALLSAYGACPPAAPCPADLDGDGDVGFSDTIIILTRMGFLTGDCYPIGAPDGVVDANDLAYIDELRHTGCWDPYADTNCDGDVDQEDYDRASACAMP